MPAECVGHINITKSGSLIPISSERGYFSCQLVETIELIWGKLMDFFSVQCCFNRLWSVCGSWNLLSFPKHSHTIPLVPRIPDTCARSCLLYKPCSHYEKEPPGMNREGGQRTVNVCFYSSLPVLRYSALLFMCSNEEKDRNNNIAIIKCSC